MIDGIPALQISNEIVPDFAIAKLDFDNIFDFIHKNTVCNQVEKFYELNKAFRANKKILPIIKYCFFYRTLIHVILNFRFYDPEPDAILEKCLNKIKNI